MKNGVKIRFIIFEILLEIYKHNSSFENIFNSQCSLNNFSKRDKSLINNVCLNSMRYKFHVDKIIKKYLKKKSKKNQYILLLSAVTQIIFLDFKEYAVVDNSVEIAKKINVYPGLINAVLKKICDEKTKLKQIKVFFRDFPEWFKKYAENLDIRKKIQFEDNYYKTPSLHLVFKSEELLKNFKEKYIISSTKSVFLAEPKKIELISNYKKGDWWVQDFSSMLPLHLTFNLKNKNIFDLCSAPGGKAFQAISQGGNVTLNDKNKKRIIVLKKNLKRLNFKNHIINEDILNLSIKKKYDCIILDAPCSAIGTIRRNPEIFYKNKAPNINELFILQRKLLQKASLLVNQNGVLLYMVCSFFYKETLEQMKYFLSKNKNFSILKFDKIEKYAEMNTFVDSKGYILIPPTTYKSFFIDGFFGVKFIKND